MTKGEKIVLTLYMQKIIDTGTNSGGDHIKGKIQNYVVINQKGGEC